jgi:2-isopropylmalate synthase
MDPMNGTNRTTRIDSSGGRRPFFYDVTLRDGNQALRQPWNVQEKEKVFRQLLKLGVQGIEAGYAGASDLDFEAVSHLATLAPADVVFSSLARAVPRDIERAAAAVRAAPRPRIHTFIGLSPFAMENVLRMPPEKVAQKAVEAVAMCRDMLEGRGDVQFSAEHFGDSMDNLDFVIETFHRVIEAGATVINLPNTVERYRPLVFVDMVRRVVEALPKHVTVAVHTHNDLGMATATTVESFFAGATQLECALNGLGERAGNTNLYEVAVAIHNCGVENPLNMKEIYETALQMAEWSRVPIYEKAPLVGSDVVAHRSGIHQDGAAKTKGMKKGAYRAVEGDLIGRGESDRVVFTSQSGKSAVYEIVKAMGLPITLEEAAVLQPILKFESELKGGELSDQDIARFYEQALFETPKEPFSFLRMWSESETDYRFEVNFTNSANGTVNTIILVGSGTGPVDACMHAIESYLNQKFHLAGYSQQDVDAEHNDSAAFALSEIRMQKKNALGQPEGAVVIGRGKSADTVKANVKALFNGVNRLLAI